MPELWHVEGRDRGTRIPCDGWSTPCSGFHHIHHNAWPVPALTTEAVNRKNVDQLHGKIVEHLEFVQAGGQFERHRREQLKRVVLNILRHRFEREFLDRLMEKVEFNKVVDDIYAGRSNPFMAGNELYEQFADQRG